jgi:SPP1 family predicted phage head-tail adaptor
MTYRAGELDQRVILMRLSHTPDGMGGNTVTWAEIDTVWAKVRPMTGTEREHSDRLNDVSNYLVVIRQRSDLTEADKVQWRGFDYNIRFIKTSPRSRFLELECEKGVAQ